MDLRLDEKYEELRLKARVFLAENWALRSPGTDEEEAVKAFRRVATEAGFFFRRFPREYGGGGEQALGFSYKDPLASGVIKEEFSKAGAPLEAHTIGTNMLAPTLLARGEAWQKEKFLPRTLTGEYKWCQGYSEPGSGSDLASVGTRAELRDGQWVINGQKIWTSFAQVADFMFVLVRTEPDAPKHRGISYLLLDMKQPGITIRPLRQMMGEYGFNEVFFDDAHTPADWIVGQRGEGWSVSTTTLSFERAAINSPEMMDGLIEKVRADATRRTRGGIALIEHPAIRERLSEIEEFAFAHRCSVMRQNAMDAAGLNPGLATFCNKLMGTELIGLRIARLWQDIISEDGLLMPASEVTRDDMDCVYWLFRSIGTTIAGGTSNVQRNIIAERGLGLPKE